MTREERNKLIDLLNNYEPNCNNDCFNCEYGMMPAEGYMHTCPLETVQLMVYNEKSKGE